ADRLRATFVPGGRLASFTLYYVYMYGITDLAGQAAYSFTSFTTAAGAQTSAPSVVALSPAAGSTDVPIDTHVAARISAPLNPLTVGAGAITVSTGGQPVAGTVSLGADRQILTFTPAANLAAAATYSVTVAGVRDLAGNLLSPANGTFTTGTTAAGANPFRVTAVVPSNGTASVPVNSTVRVTFARLVDPTSVAVNTMTLSVPGVGNLAARYAVAGNEVTIAPAAPMPGDAQVSLQIQGVLDLAGNANAYWNSSFRTAAVPDTIPPTVINV